MDNAVLCCQWRHPRFDYLEARTADEACSLLSQFEGKSKLIAGGTDLLVAMRARKIPPLCVINIKAIPDLNYIDHDGHSLRLGALATLSDIESSPLVRDKFPVIADSARKIGTPQVRNVATVGGNLCNAAPSADMAPSLIGLESKAKIKGPKGERTVALDEFFTGPGETILRTGEMLTEIQVPDMKQYTGAVYLKLPARTAIGLAVVGVSAVITLNSTGTSVVDARIVLGAVAPTPIRAREAESLLKGKVIEDKLIDKVAEVAAQEARPISDVRGSASYRKEMISVLTKQAIKQAVTCAR